MATARPGSVSAHSFTPVSPVPSPPKRSASKKEMIDEMTEALKTSPALVIKSNNDLLKEDNTLGGDPIRSTGSPRANNITPLVRQGSVSPSGSRASPVMPQSFVEAYRTPIRKAYVSPLLEPTDVPEIQTSLLRQASEIDHSLLHTSVSPRLRSHSGSQAVSPRSPVSPSIASQVHSSVAEHVTAIEKGLSMREFRAGKNFKVQAVPEKPYAGGNSASSTPSPRGSSPKWLEKAAKTVSFDLKDVSDQKPEVGLSLPEAKSVASGEASPRLNRAVSIVTKAGQDWTSGDAVVAPPVLERQSSRLSPKGYPESPPLAPSVSSVGLIELSPVASSAPHFMSPRDNPKPQPLSSPYRTAVAPLDAFGSDWRQAGDSYLLGGSFVKSANTCKACNGSGQGDQSACPVCAPFYLNQTTNALSFRGRGLKAVTDDLLLGDTATTATGSSDDSGKRECMRTIPLVKEWVIGRELPFPRAPDHPHSRTCPGGLECRHTDSRMARQCKDNKSGTVELLDLSENHLASIACVSALPNILELRVAYNSLSHSLPMETFAQLRRLSVLDVSYNRLTDLSALVSCRHTLRVLKAKQNRLRVVNGIDACPLLEDLDLSDNLIANKDALTSLALLGKLMIVDLRGNPVTDYQPEMVGLCNSLTRVAVFNGEIISLGPAGLNKGRGEYPYGIRYKIKSDGVSRVGEGTESSKAKIVDSSVAAASDSGNRDTEGLERMLASSVGRKESAAKRLLSKEF